MLDFFKRLLIQILPHISHITSKIHMPFSRKLVTGEDFFSYIKQAQMGDVILSRTNGELSNLGIPGFISHVGIVSGPTTVVEALTAGVDERDLVTFFMGKDYIVVVRPKFADPEQMAVASRFAKLQVGKKYDFDFNTSDIKSFYCSELVWWAYIKACGVIPFIPREILGRQTISPQDFLDAKDKFKPVWGSKSFMEL